MSLENIIKKIIDDAQVEADEIISESKKKADEIKDAARKEASQLAEAVAIEAERQGNLEASRIITQARLEKKINILSCKKELITEILERAFEKGGVDKERIQRKIIMKDGEKEEAQDRERLKEEIRAALENEIVEFLKI